MSEAEHTTRKSHSGDYSEFDVCFKYYEKAIEGRNFHYQNYNTWVNYYAIFTGALFVGYYTIIDKCKINVIIPCLIVFLGYITSLCWHLTVKGHYHWMLSWIKVVQSYEEELAKIKKNNERTQWYVYSLYMPSDSGKYHKNISSQKLTSIFTFMVSCAWFILFFLEFKKLNLFRNITSFFHFDSLCDYINLCDIVGSFFLILLVRIICLSFLEQPSDVKKIDKLIYKK